MNFISTLAKRSASLAVALLTVVSAGSFAIAAPGPDRPTKAWSEGVSGFEYVTFNSFTGMAGKGDERDFLEGTIYQAPGTWRDPVNDIKNDSEIEVKLYMHNNADTSLNDAPGNPGIARDVNARVTVPAGLTTTKDLTGYISASNAQPTVVYDTLTLNSINGSLFELEPVVGSGRLMQNGAQIGSVDVNALVSANGVDLADQNGCSEFTREIIFRLRVKKPGYQIQKSARIAGEGSDKWRENVATKIGDTIEWRIFFQNIGQTDLTNVMIVDQVPPSMTVVAGSVQIDAVDANTNQTVTRTYGPEAVQNGGRQINVNIGNYPPNGGSYLYFSTKIVDSPTLKCGNISLQNVAYATPEGFGTVNDGAFVTVVTNRTCVPTTPPKELPKTGAGSLIGTFGAVTAAGMFISRRLALRK